MDEDRGVMLAENEWKLLSTIRAQGFWILVLLAVIVIELAMLIGRVS